MRPGYTIPCKGNGGAGICAGPHVACHCHNQSLSQPGVTATVTGTYLFQGRPHGLPDLWQVEISVHSCSGVIRRGAAHVKHRGYACCVDNQAAQLLHGCARTRKQTHNGGVQVYTNKHTIRPLAGMDDAAALMPFVAGCKGSCCSTPWTSLILLLPPRSH